jgi:hypothetical protein
MVDPISISNIASTATEKASFKPPQVITNENFESVHLKSQELDTTVDKLRASGQIDGDQIKLASTEAQAMFDRYVQPGNEVGGYHSLFHDNRTKLESLRVELDRVSAPEQSNQVTDYLNGIDKELNSLEGILNSVDINAPINPMEMIKLQTKMQFVTEHVEILSKVVEQVSSGMKTILQTNV